MAEVLYHPNGKPVSEEYPLYVTWIGGGGGSSLEFEWDGTKLGVRQEGDTEYEYVDLQGSAGADGEQGPPGADGEDGAQGPAGADGFPTEEQWNDLVARVEVLEG